MKSIFCRSVQNQRAITRTIALELIVRAFNRPLLHRMGDNSRSLCEQWCESAVELPRRCRCVQLLTFFKNIKYLYVKSEWLCYCTLNFKTEGRYYKDQPSASLEYYGVDQIFVHPYYNPFTIDNDIALLHIDSPIEYNSYVQPVCLPNRDAYVSEMARITGCVVRQPILYQMYLRATLTTYMPLLHVADGARRWAPGGTRCSSRRRSRSSRIATAAAGWVPRCRATWSAPAMTRATTAAAWCALLPEPHGPPALLPSSSCFLLRSKNNAERSWRPLRRAEQFICSYPMIVLVGRFWWPAGREGKLQPVDARRTGQLGPPHLRRVHSLQSRSQLREQWYALSWKRTLNNRMIR